MPIRKFIEAVNAHMSDVNRFGLSGVEGSKSLKRRRDRLLTLLPAANEKFVSLVAKSINRPLSVKERDALIGHGKALGYLAEFVDSFQAERKGKGRNV